METVCYLQENLNEHFWAGVIFGIFIGIIIGLCVLPNRCHRH